MSDKDSYRQSIIGVRMEVIALACLLKRQRGELADDTASPSNNIHAVIDTHHRAGHIHTVDPDIDNDNEVLSENVPLGRFLDRLAFVLAGGETGKHVTETAYVTVKQDKEEDIPKIYVTKNKSAYKYQSHANKMQKWLRNVATKTATEAEKIPSTRQSIIDKAREIRLQKRSKNELEQPRPQPLTSLYLLGLYRASFETFQTFASKHSPFRDLRIECVPDTNGLGDQILWPEILETMKLFRPNHQFQLKERTWEGKVHAEIQMLNHLESLGENETPHLYIGCSKKACWMCHVMLQEYTLQSCTESIGRKLRMKHSSLQIFKRWDPPFFDSEDMRDEYLRCLTKMRDLMFIHGSRNPLRSV
ncbi:hypothetical protein CC80DRAFT_509754 [Byssothecium circinans]|uniref:Uncharacterized protein n=1 Tax=Byssothecium circinans TaxID=147558 RepID=A0A6A5TCT4_9PLEO|nr:hypothetical protein CC80DRAFT_509754 [Byssothecium circinans]